jgi:hypothetical protein
VTRLQKLLCVLGGLGVLSAIFEGHHDLPVHKVDAVKAEPKTVENMCDHLPTYSFADGSSYSPEQGCLTQQRLMQNEGLSGDFNAASERYVDIVCERANWRGICENDLKQRAARKQQH